MRALVLLAVGCGPTVHDTFTVVHDRAVLPVAVHGDGGSGTLVLFESGGPSGPGIAERTVGFVDFRDTLEQDALVAIYDRRGVGNAHGSYRAGDLTIDVLLDDLEAVQDVLESRYAPERVVLMGHSFGGQSSALYIERDPSRVDLWIPVAPGWSNDDIAVENTYRYAWMCRVAADGVAEGRTGAAFDDALAFCATQGVPEVGGPQQERFWTVLSALGDAVDTFPTMAVGGLIEAVAASHYGLIDTQLRKNTISRPVGESLQGVQFVERVSRLDVPTLAITGELDMIGATEMVDAAVGAMEAPHEIVQIEGAGHYPMYHDPEGFADAVRRWLDPL